MSLFPVLKGDDDELIMKYKDARLIRDNVSLSAKSEQDIEQSDIIIADDDFAALLNIDREITVGEFTYHYFGKGVLRSNEDNASRLKSISKKK